MNSIIPYFSLFILLFCSPKLFAQEIFTINKEGTPIAVTQEIEEDFLGLYIQNDGQNKWQYGLHKGEQSFFLKQNNSLDNPNLEWDMGLKTSIRWGVKTVDGQIHKFMVSEFENGHLVEYPAMTLIYKDLKSSEVHEVYLYQKNGDYILGHAQKVNAMVSN